jgi:hypothetical protein
VRLKLFPFCFRDPINGKWLRARNVANREEIAQRHAEFEIAGPPEIREVDEGARSFSPHRSEGNVGEVLEIAGWRQARPVRLAGVAI